MSRKTHVKLAIDGTSLPESCVCVFRGWILLVQSFATCRLSFQLINNIPASDIF